MKITTERHSIQNIPSTTRIEQFSDGVLSIVIILLVFQITLPDTTTVLRKEDVLALVPTLTTFALSFFIIATYWIKHHQLFHILQTSDRKLLWLNTHFLFWIGLVPFASSLLGHHLFEKIATAVYGVSMMSVSGSFYALRRYATNKRDLLFPDIEPHKLSIEVRKIGLITFLYLSGVFISSFSPVVATVLYLLAAITAITKVPKKSFVFTGIPKK